MIPHSPLASSVPAQERILVIYTGGTIGMQQHAEGLRLAVTLPLAWQRP